MSSMQEYNEAMIYKIMHEQFMNQVQVVLNLYTKYDTDTLALLDDVPPEKRYKVLMQIKRSYVKVSLEILETTFLIARMSARAEKAKNEGKMTKYYECMNHNIYNQIWLDKNKALLEQAKSQFAMFRSLALVQAFEQQKKRGGFLGLGGDALQKMGKKLEDLKGKKKGTPDPRLTDAENQQAFDAGLDPSTILPKE